ncbi:hypothetical protein C8034_v008835 [Colletotrichum sidae]|uniref:Uncharacterized protein n=1 Tax=Colletotrichum sidae TaxID=1347389 RepID=A0A4R8TN75_9PEZI|nr:hypothetical protein C8034_v008835 [Colletotrichum sidae]
MASLARPTLGQSRLEEKRAKRDTHKSRRALFALPSQKKSPGYPASWVSRWKHRQQYALAKPQSPRHELPPGPLILGRQASTPSSSRQDEDEEVPPVTLPQTITIGPEVYSLNRFYVNYATTASIVFFERLPVHYTNDLSDASHTRHATHAVALASASQQLHQSGLMVEARKHYGKAIVTLNQALRDPVRVRDDSNLVTLFLFGMFEVIVGKKSPKAIDLENNVFPHGTGGLQLFKFRAMEGLTNDVDKGSFMFYCHAALMETFIQREHLTGIWSVLEEVETPWGKGLILEPLVRQVVDFKKAVDFKLHVQSNLSDTQHSDELLELLRGGAGLVRDLEAAVMLLDFSGASCFAGQPQKVFNGLFSLSSDVSIAIARSHYRSLKLYVLERVIDLRGTLKETAVKIGHELGQIPKWSDGVAVVDEVLDDIRTVFGLEGKAAPTEGLPYRTMTMFWPMVLVRTSPFAGPHNGRWVAEKMLELTSESGFGLGVEAANL